VQKITPFLWFNNNNAEEAMNYYVSVFKNARIAAIQHFPNDTHVGLVGTLEINSQTLYLFNGGSASFTFNESISLMVACKDQAEIDHLWEKLSAVPESEACGWCKDKFGISWQIVPDNLHEYMASKSAIQALWNMKKLDIAKLEAARKKA
jgi:predicted 3-demethylubiquinone-9 3-methyltransferase (glyoxalase superfamily)